MEMLGQEVVQARSDFGIDFRHQRLESIHDGIDIPEEDARIPVELVAFHKYFGKFQLRLFDESLHLIEIILLFIGYLDVTVTCFRTVGLDT